MLLRLVQAGADCASVYPLRAPVLQGLLGSQVCCRSAQRLHSPPTPHPQAAQAMHSLQKGIGRFHGWPHFPGESTSASEQHFLHLEHTLLKAHSVGEALSCGLHKNEGFVSGTWI